MFVLLCLASSLNVLKPLKVHNLCFRTSSPNLCILVADDTSESCLSQSSHENKDFDEDCQHNGMSFEEDNGSRTSSQCGILDASNYVDKIGLDEEKKYMDIVARQNLYLYQDPTYEFDPQPTIIDCQPEIITPGSPDYSEYDTDDSSDLISEPEDGPVYTEPEYIRFDDDDAELIPPAPLSCYAPNSRNICDLSLMKLDSFKARFVRGNAFLMVDTNSTCENQRLIDTNSDRPLYDFLGLKMSKEVDYLEFNASTVMNLNFIHHGYPDSVFKVSR